MKKKIIDKKEMVGNKMVKKCMCEQKELFEVDYDINQEIFSHCFYALFGETILAD